MSNTEDSAPLLKISIKREGADQSGKETYSIVPENFNLPESSQSSSTSPNSTTQSESLSPKAQSPNATTVFSHGQYVKCGVPRCNNYFDGQRQEFIGISYFPFPEELELRNQWLKAIDLPEETDTQPLKICSQHFGNNDIYNMQEADGKTTAHLKPNAYPCKKLYAFVQNHSQQAYVSGKFIGFENPLMDTSQDVSAAKRKSELLTTDKDALPKITSVLSTDAMGQLVDSSGNLKPKHKKKGVKQMGGICEEELIGEEMISSDDTDISRRPINPEKGLQVIPALVKLPPRLPKVDLVGDSVNVEGSASVGPITTSRLPNVDLTNEMDAAKEDKPVTEISGELATSSIPEILSSDHFPIKRRRGRRTKEEMRRREEDDDWEPSFWGRKALKKDGYSSHLDADKKRKENKNRNKTTRSNGITDFPSKQSNEEQKSQEDGLEEEDEGWRVVEPIATGESKSDEEAEDDSNNPLALLEVSMADGESEGNPVPSAAKRRPGPASKTCRPRYIPPTKDTEADDVVEETGNDKSKEYCPDENQPNLPSDDGPYGDSLLVDWSFFKSLLPDLGKLSHEKRIELKSFVLDTLNSAIYDGKPITPILNL